jgi:hypothetical protein
VADLTRPLMSVSQLCEQGFRVEFKDTHALVIDSSGRTACRFQRSGQLYTSQMTLKAPRAFSSAELTWMPTAPAAHVRPSYPPAYARGDRQRSSALGKTWDKL